MTKPTFKEKLLKNIYGNIGKTILLLVSLAVTIAFCTSGIKFKMFGMGCDKTTPVYPSFKGTAE